VGDDQAPGRAKCVCRCLVGGEPAKAVGVDEAELPRWYGEQVRVLGDHQAAHIVRAELGEIGLVGGRVLAGVVDDGQLVHPVGDVAVAGDQLIDDLGELSDVGPGCRHRRRRPPARRRRG
jgi:hypothetical protein